MADYVISAANLAVIERNLRGLNESLEVVNSNISFVNDRIGNVSDDVATVQGEVSALAAEFAKFLVTYNNKTQLTISHTEIVRIRQELEQKYGHLEQVRKKTTGILQANDLGFVRKDTINTVTEELMLAAPNYWLAPCLVALAAWIDDNPALAEKAMLEGLRRNDDNTSLFFALVCRRANRKQAALKWVQRYLANQDEENLDRNAVILLDAFAGGLMGADSEGLISKQIGKWIDHLEQKPDFIDQQIKQWSDAINLKKRPMVNDEYALLPKFSKTWPIMQEVMEGAQLHADILSYFIDIFNQESSTDAVKAQLDEILDNLVNNFDDEELPLRKEERLHTRIIEFDGDKPRAEASIALEESAFLEKKDFTQLLTDAAMNPESAHSSVSTQKFAVALSKNWISQAYNDVVAQNRMKVPHEIEINVDSFNTKTRDGRDEQRILGDFHRKIDEEKGRAQSTNVLTGFEQFCLFGGIVIGLIGLLMLFSAQILLGVIAIIGAILMVSNYVSKNNAVKARRQNVENFYEKKRADGQKVIRALLAEIVDFRYTFAQKDSESEKVVQFLEEISPDQYVKRLSESTRKIKLN